VSRARLTLALASVVAALAACGGGGPTPKPRPPAEPLSAALCGPVSYEGPGRPDVLIALSSGLQGVYRPHGVQNAQAMKLVLARRGWRAGEHRVGMQVCEETSARTGSSSPARCARNARAFAANRAVLGVVGPLTSVCAATMLPILNRGPDGPVPMIGTNTYVGLTRAAPGTAPGEPGKYIPSGRRSYVRLVPADDTQAAVGALMARRLGRTRAFVVWHDEPFGVGLAAAFRESARRLGIELSGSAEWDAAGEHYRAIAERIRSAGSDVVFVAGDAAANGLKLIRDLTAVLGPEVVIIAPDAFNIPTELVEAAGEGAEGMRITIAVLPNDRLPEPGRRFAAEFERRYSQRPCCFAVHHAQATEMLLDAIADSQGSRARAAGALMHAQIPDGLIGDFAVDPSGDTTLATMGVYRIQDGRLRFEAAVTPAPELLARSSG
jgi:branched-chain amino acid transport system substrate-binding protein